MINQASPVERPPRSYAALMPLCARNARHLEIGALISGPAPARSSWPAVTASCALCCYTKPDAGISNLKGPASSFSSGLFQLLPLSGPDGTRGRNNGPLLHARSCLSDAEFKGHSSGGGDIVSGIARWAGRPMSRPSGIRWYQKHLIGEPREFGHTRRAQFQLQIQCAMACQIGRLRVGVERQVQYLSREGSAFLIDAPIQAVLRDRVLPSNLAIGRSVTARLEINDTNAQNSDGSILADRSSVFCSQVQIEERLVHLPRTCASQRCERNFEMPGRSPEWVDSRKKRRVIRLPSRWGGRPCDCELPA
ncbi:hypothetical protein SAMN05892877_116111 [Rhizobium subbaraonis]|uniref:Uncharacterized protein n=1 Tax=Rhizobium subbaraonis TaxID=908946 RepID=A0A285UUI3_9HYPH|nr:hypothetical protein SAMN05892877_116111 [Rhizobium subbaraonis]